jgi:hypothetical protein
MKSKVQYQVQPRQTLPSSDEEVDGEAVQEQVQEEIKKFQLALDSYPARAAKEPSVSFQQHLCSISAGRSDGDRRSGRTRRQ